MVGESQALDVARERGMPREILERAEKYLLLDGPETGGVMDRLNELALQRERELDRLEDERRRLEAKRRKLEQSFEREKQALLKEVKAKAREIVHEWQQGKKSRKRALKELSETRKGLVETGRTAEKPEQEETPATLDMGAAEPGTRAAYPAFGKIGVIRERDEKRGLVKLDMDGVAMWVKPGDLRPHEERSRPERAVTGAKAGTGTGLSLDLRGYRADEARSELARFLDRAIMSGHQNLEVVHGKGTGALRREVRDVLEKSPVVSNYELAPEEAGGDGMTRVELK
jgi:DNA mismatch repair protein MutS2